MWMCYADLSWPKVVNRLGAVQRLQSRLSMLEDDAEHEAIYGSGIFSQEYCEELARRYKEGYSLCSEYIAGKRCMKCLIQALIMENLGAFVQDLSQYSSDIDEEEEQGAGDQQEEQEATCSQKEEITEGQDTVDSSKL